MRSQLQRALELGGADVPPRPTEFLSARSSALESRARSLAKPASLLFSDPREDRDEQIANGPAGVEPRFAHADHLHAESVELDDGVDVSEHRPPEAIERPHEQHAELTATRGEHHRVERWTRRRRAAHRFDVLADELEPACVGNALEISALIFGVLPSPRNPPVPDRQIARWRAVQ